MWVSLSLSRYPAASFRKILARAFVASRSLDYLLAPAADSAASVTGAPVSTPTESPSSSFLLSCTIQLV